MNISIITINYNNVTGLKKTINSVLSQTFKEYEYILIDGGSTDGSIKLIEQHSETFKCWISEPDGGIYHAMNKGIKRSSGDYLIFLNSGDAFSNADVLVKCNENILKYSPVDIFYSDIIGVKNDNSWVHKHPTKLTLDFFFRNNLNHQASLFRRTLFEDFGLYPAEFRLAADHWLFLVSFMRKKKFMHVNDAWVIYDYSGQSSNMRDKYVVEMDILWRVNVPGYLRFLVKQYLQTNNRYVKIFMRKVINAHAAFKMVQN